MVGAVKYYTALVDRRTEKSNGEIDRQKYWLDALEHGSQRKILVVEGFHKVDEEGRRKKKKTDTNIVVGMIRDVLPHPPVMISKRQPRNPCGAVILMSGDSDFRPAVEMIRHEYDKGVAVFRPHNDERPIPDGRIKVHRVTKEDLVQSRLGDVITRRGGPDISWARCRELRRLA